MFGPIVITPLSGISAATCQHMLSWRVQTGARLRVGYQLTMDGLDGI